MLNAFPVGRSLSKAVWIDRVEPTPPEIADFEKAFGLRVPSKDDLTEIEATSRLRVDNNALYMTAPLIIATGDEPWLESPTGFVLSKTVFLTVHFCKISNLRCSEQGVGGRKL